MAVKSVAEALANYKQGIANGQQAYTNGINGVQVSPGQQANTPEAQAAYLAGINAAIANGKRSRSLGYSLQDWKSAAASYGASNYANSANKAGTKYQKALSYLQPAWQAASNAAKSVTGPKGKATAMAKVSAAMDAMIAVKGGGGHM